MKQSMVGTNPRSESGNGDGVPDAVDDLEKTREIPAVADEGIPPKATTSAPRQPIPIEKTVPVQSCIERTLLQEVLRRQSAENDDE